MIQVVDFGQFMYMRQMKRTDELHCHWWEIFYGIASELKKLWVTRLMEVFLQKNWPIGGLNLNGLPVLNRLRDLYLLPSVGGAARAVLERSIAWTNFFRRIIKDYEYTLSSSVGWLLLANIQIILQRIKPTNQI